LKLYFREIARDNFTIDTTFTETSLSFGFEKNGLKNNKKEDEITKFFQVAIRGENAHTLNDWIVVRYFI
jgi:hypothetical protein